MCMYVCSDMCVCLWVYVYVCVGMCLVICVCVCGCMCVDVCACVRTVSLRIKVVELRSRDSRGDPKLKVARVPPGSRRGTAKVALRS